MLVDIEKLMEEVIDGNDDELLESFYEALLDHWVYFHFNEHLDRDTKPGQGNVEVVLFVDRDNPIHLPLVENEHGLHGVVFTNSDLAIHLAEFNCKVGKMRGKNAFRLFSDIENLSSVYIQGNYGKLRPSNVEFANLCAGFV